MIKYIAFLFTVVSCNFVFAQSTADFENFDLEEVEFLNNDEQGLFESGNIQLPNIYDSNYDFWTGWAISRAADTETPGFNNQYSSIVGSGNEDSSNFAVGYASEPIKIYLDDESIGKVVDGMYVTNSTYAFQSMSLGDAFAKKFGGATGEDPDFFLLTIKKWLDGEMGVDSVDFYLADFRSDNSAWDYIIDQWEYVDLSILGNVDSLQLTLSSSDVGQFGMNTPAYFCVDDVTTANVSNIVTQHQTRIYLLPNPAVERISLEVEDQESYDYLIYNNQGSVVETGNGHQGNTNLNIEGYTPGTYYVVVRKQNEMRTVRFVKM